MFGLIKNEFSKLIRQKATWIMLIGLVALVILMGIITSAFDDLSTSYSSDWREELQKENEETNKFINDNPDLAEFYQEDLAVNNYYLENDIKPPGYSAWNFVGDNVGLVSVISLITIIVAAGIVANEFRWGTIKLLLIRPISRSKILMSKYLAVLSFALISLVLLVGTATIVGLLIFGGGPLFKELPMLSFGDIVEQSHFIHIIKTYSYQLVNLVMMATFAFMISAVFRNSSLAVGLGIFLMLSGSILVAQFRDQTWAKYILFAHTDLQQYEAGYPIIPDITLGFSIAVLLVYFVVFIALAWGVFTKRDVRGT